MQNKPAIQDSVSTEQLDQLAKAWSRMVDCISHDVTSPLTSIRAACQALDGTLPDLIKVYRAAVAHNVPDLPEINDRILALLELHLVPSINRGTRDITNFLALLHPLDTKIPSDSKDIKTLSAQAVIDQLLTNYAFKNDQDHALVHNECKHDFKFRCAEIFIEHLLDNLLQNALEHIRDANKGTISIWTETANSNEIHFKDTSTGIAEEKLPKIFDRFFSKRKNTIIPGLGFCRLAILQAGGNVFCHSKKGEYTEFVIKFPKI